MPQDQQRSIRNLKITVPAAQLDPDPNMEVDLADLLRNAAAERARGGPNWEAEQMARANPQPEDMETVMARLQNTSAPTRSSRSPDRIGDLISAGQNFPYLTEEQMQRIAPNTSDPADWTNRFNAAMMRFGINTRALQAAFLSQVMAESGGLRNLTENHNYTADNIRLIFNPSRYRGYTPESLAAESAEIKGNVLYANQVGNGDVSSGDGSRFLGRGPMQLTGRENYDRAGKALGRDLLANPELVGSDPDVGAQTAAWFFSDKPGLMRAAEEGNISRVGTLVNGGSNGADERAAAYRRIKSIFADTAP